MRHAAAKKRQLPHVLALFLCLLASACSRSQPALEVAPESCRVEPSQLTGYRVEKITDGDTLRLAGGDKVRLIGINTPELGYGKSPSQPLAKEAREGLVSLLPGKRVWLLDGTEPRDAHGRRLAWAFDAEGRSIGAALLEQGLGYHVAIAPNIEFSDCLGAAEAGARRRGVGVWGLDDARPRSIAGLDKGYRGFILLEDRVTHVSFKDNGWWIQLGGKVGVKIAPENQRLFSRSAVAALDGKTVQVRGWLVPMSGGWWVLTLGSPAMMQPDAGAR